MSPYPAHLSPLHWYSSVGVLLPVGRPGIVSAACLVVDRSPVVRCVVELDMMTRHRHRWRDLWDVVSVGPLLQPTRTVSRSPCMVQRWAVVPEVTVAVAIVTLPFASIPELLLIQWPVVRVTPIYVPLVPGILNFFVVMSGSIRG